MTQKTPIKLNYLALAALIVLPVFSLVYSHGLALAGTHTKSIDSEARIAKVQSVQNLR